MYGNYAMPGYMPQQQMNPMPDMLSQLRQTQAQPSGGIIWVQGEAAAKSHPVSPGTSAALFDSEGDTFYIKTVDVSGMPMPLRIFKYTEIMPQTAPAASESPSGIDMSKYLTREELAAVLAEMGFVAQEKKGVDDGE